MVAYGRWSLTRSGRFERVDCIFFFFIFFCSLLVVKCYDVDEFLNLGPSEIGYHIHLVEHSTRVGVLVIAVLHRADESQPARNSCLSWLPHSVDSRRVWFLSCRCRVKFSTQSDQPCRNLSHLYFWLIRSSTDPAYTCSIFFVRFLLQVLPALPTSKLVRLPSLSRE